MRRILTMVIVAMLLSIGAYASGFKKSGKAGKLSVTIISEKPLTKGINDLTIVLKKGDKSVNGAKVLFKVFMPEMPGMPFMQDKKRAQFIGDGKYAVKINFTMRGTWQVRIYIITQDNKKYLYKSSINL